jgi:ribosomal-protein-alanine N-acetyltransferase
MDSQPSIETERLHLRPFRLSDAKDVQKIAGDIRISKTTLSVPHPYPDGVAEKWISSQPQHYQKGLGVVFAITLKSSNALIGCMSIEGISKEHSRGEAGYWIGCDYWNQGFATEALKAVVDFVFKTLQLNKVTSRHMSKNPQSGRVMIKAGMTQEGLLKDDCFRNGQFEDSVAYGILRKDYELLVGSGV